MQSKISGPELVQMKNAVVKDFDSSNWRELGALTNNLEKVENHPRLLRSLDFGDPDYDGLALTFLRKMIGPNDENLRVVQGYINKKCTDTGEDVSSEQSNSRKIVFSPNIFQIPNESVDPNLISVMMPFRSELSVVYKTIEEAARVSGFYCKKVNDIWNHSTVIQDVFSLLSKIDFNLIPSR